MNWEKIVPSIETVRTQNERFLEVGGPAAVASNDQDLMFFKNVLNKMDLPLQDLTDRDLYMIMATTVLNWWIALRNQDSGNMTTEEYSAVIAAASKTAWGFLSLTRPDWLTDESLDR